MPKQKKHKTKKIQKQEEQLIWEDNSKKEKTKPKNKELIKNIIISLSSSLVIALGSYLFTRSLKYMGITFLTFLVLIQIYFLTKKLLKKSALVKKMEEVFPDFIELMASNLRAGMTIDRALLLSSRKEFAPLDKEILNLGKDILTGKDICYALLSMADRIKSEKIRKTITVINSGIRSGGNLAILLEQTAINMREREFVEKRAASNVLMYVIFIFFAIAIGAPLLFALSTILVQVLTNILGNLPDVETSLNVPLALTSISISTNFIIYFSIFFLIIIDILASLLLGLVGKGEERAGLKYIAPLIALSITVFFIIRTFLTSYLSNII